MTRWWSYSQTVVVAVFFMVVVLTTPARSQNTQTNILIQSCSQANVSNPQDFFSNLNQTFGTIRQQLSNNTYFATAELTRNSEPIYVLAQCRRYMSTRDCVGCFDFAASSIRACAAANGAQAVLDGCSLRYESNSFYTDTTTPGNQGLCGNRTSSRQSVFDTAVDGLLSNLSIATSRMNNFYAAATTPVVGTNTSSAYVVGTNTSIAYAIAQCSETVTPDGCRNCLQVAYNNIRSCAFDLIDRRAVDAGCFMRYSGTAFFGANQTIDITPFLREGDSNKTRYKIGLVAGGVSFLLLVLTFLLWCYRRKNAVGRERDGPKLKGAPYYNYKQLKLSTNNFSEENMIGKGGFGEVFKAILDDKKVVAVKKLKIEFAGAKVGFENEIQLISPIRHRNLLSLLGWSSEGSNLLLVLEYMPNGSLDKFLWGAKRGNLNWKTRYEIILGIARGLAHLHKECHVRIIHRDIKSSNILLNDDFQPKIADFGLARFQPEDHSHITTKFAGTLGYTAPEYVLYGHLSDKADTFSFGIVILEIVSGQKCTYRNFDASSTNGLLENAWKLYETKNLMKLVDETMDVNQYKEEHVMKMIEIALLCTQSPASRRPTMSDVVSMLPNVSSFGERQLIRPNFIGHDWRIQTESL